MDSVFAQYTRPLKGLKPRLDLGRAEFNGAASVATNLKEADTSKTRNYLIAGAALPAGAALAASSPTNAAVKTIVLVHGAFADGSGWKPAADILQSRCSLAGRAFYGDIPSTAFR